MEPKKNCESCRFWTRLHAAYCSDYEMPLVSGDEVGTPDIGDCRRFPPVMDGVELSRLSTERIRQTGEGDDDAIHHHRQAATNHPMTWDVDWCGEWTAKELPT